MEFCPYCQRWVEPTKGNTDILIGLAVGGPIGALIGTGNYLLKGWRCPICNRLIAGLGATAYVPPEAQVRSQPVDLPRKPCIQCSTMISKTARYCNQCGAEQVPRMASIVEKPMAMKDSIAATESAYSLKEKGAITSEEFEKLKSTLLGIPQSAPQVTQLRTSPPASEVRQSESVRGLTESSRSSAHVGVLRETMSEMVKPTFVKPEQEKCVSEQTIAPPPQISSLPSQWGVFCSRCGRRVKAGDYCSLCGEPLVENPARPVDDLCPRCGGTVDLATLQCHDCAAQFDTWLCNLCGQPTKAGAEMCSICRTKFIWGNGVTRTHVSDRTLTIDS